MALNNTISAEDARLIAAQRTSINGLMEQVVYPKIEESASYGYYEAEIFLFNNNQFTVKNVTQVLAILETQGYKAKVDQDNLIIEWK